MTPGAVSARSWVAYLALGGVAVTLFLLLPAGSVPWIVLFVVSSASAVVAIVAGVQLHQPRASRPWRLLALALFLFAVAGAIFYPAFSGLIPPIGFPSLVDPLYLGAYVAIGGVVAWLAVIRAGGVRRGDLLDALVLTGGMAALSSTFLIDPYFQLPEMPAEVVLVATAYPLLDLAMFGAIGWLILGGLRPNPAVALLMLALALQLGADSLAGLAHANGEFGVEHPSNTLWLAAGFAFGAAALHPSMRSLSELAPDAAPVAARRRVPALVVAGLATPVTGIALALRGDVHSEVALFSISGGIFLVAFVRVWYLLREVEYARAEADAARERAEAADHAKSEFLSRMSHELRTPLNSILGFSQLLAMSNLSEDDRDSVEHINAGGRKLLALIDDVLEFARLDAGRITLAIEPVPLTEVADAAVDLVREDARRRGITIHNELPGRPEVIVSADAHRLRQVLRNLLDNSVRYNRPSGQVTIDARQEGADVVISVTDTGPGIPERLRASMFEPFSAPSADAPGSGLGIPFAARIVEALGGELEFKTSGEGTTFAFRLPSAEAPAALAEAASANGAAAGRPPKTILYIEDSFTNLDLVRSALARHRPVRLIAATRGSTGIELAVAQRPHLILLDVKLPDMTADAVVRDLAARPDLAGTPIICLSSDASTPRSDSLLALGVQAFLPKPLDLAQFLRTVDGVLDSPASRPAAP